MKLSINKLLIGFLFVFSFILIPMDVAKANTYTVAWGALRQCQTTFDVNLYVDSPNKRITAAGGISNNSGCAGTIRVNGQDSVSTGLARLIFSGSTSLPIGGAATFTFTTNGTYYIVITGSVSDINANYSFTAGTLSATIGPPDPTVTVYAQNMTIAGSQKSASALTVPYNTDVNITWISTNATSCTCTFSGGGCGTSTINNTSQSASGNSYTLQQSKTFSVSCSN